MDVGPGGVGQTDVAVDDDFLGAGGRTFDAETVANSSLVERAWPGEFGHLAVAGEKHAELGGVFHRAQQHCGIARGVTVVGQHRHAERTHAVDACKLFAVAALGHAAGRVNRNAGRALGNIEHVGHDRGGINRGAGIWHHHHAGDTTVDRRFSAGCDRFLRLEARLAEMDVCVEHAGGQHAAAGVDHARAIGGR